MRTVPERSNAVRIVTILVAIFAGPAVANFVAPTLSPGSALVEFFAPFSFAFVLVAGIFFWIGLGIVTVLSGGLIQMARGQRSELRVEEGDRLVPPGYVAFVVLGGLVGGVLGVAGGLLSDAGIVPSLAGWLALGLGYGGALWLAAHHGYLPFPEDE